MRRLCKVAQTRACPGLAGAREPERGPVRPFSSSTTVQSPNRHAPLPYTET